MIAVARRLPGAVVSGTAHVSAFANCATEEAFVEAQVSAFANCATEAAFVDAQVIAFANSATEEAIVETRK